jgi:hypothetical protein
MFVAIRQPSASQLLLLQIIPLLYHWTDDESF